MNASASRNLPDARRPRKGTDVNLISSRFIRLVSQPVAIDREPGGKLDHPRGWDEYFRLAHPQTIALLHKLRPMYETSTLAVEFMSRMLDHATEMMESVARIIDGKRYFESRMRDLGFGVCPTEGNFTHVEFGRSAPAVHPALAGKVLYRESFQHVCLAGYSRFSVAPRPVMARVSDLIERAVKEAA